MSDFFHKKILTGFAAAAIAVVCIGATAGICLTSGHRQEEKALVFETEAESLSQETASQETLPQETVSQEAVPQESLSQEELYQAAVRDAAFADEDEIYPLVTIDRENELVPWNEEGDKVLLFSWHKYPDSYPEGETITNGWGPIWGFSGAEMAEWYKEHKDDDSDTILRWEQLIGLPAGKEYTHFTSFWVSPKDVIRPAYVTDITAQMDNKAPEKEEESEFDTWYKEWFDSNIIWSYFDSDYPWTRLGYTYDWADNGQEYGLTEFLVLPDSQITIESTMSNEEFQQWMEQQ